MPETTTLTTQAEAEHKAVVNECIINVMIAHPEITQAVKDFILREGVIMAERYAAPVVSEDEISDMFNKAYTSKTRLVKENTDSSRQQSLLRTLHRFAEQGNKLTQRYLETSAEFIAENPAGIYSHGAGIHKLKSEKLVPLMMGVLKGLLSRPKATGFFLNPAAESIIKACENSRKVWTTSDPVFEYRERTYTTLNPEVHTAASWAQLLATTKYKIVVYSICPSADVDEVNIAFQKV